MKSTGSCTSLLREMIIRLCLSVSQRTRRRRLICAGQSCRPKRKKSTWSKRRSSSMTMPFISSSNGRSMEMPSNIYLKHATRRIGRLLSLMRKQGSCSKRSTKSDKPSSKERWPKTSSLTTRIKIQKIWKKTIFKFNELMNVQIL